MDGSGKDENRMQRPCEKSWDVDTCRRIALEAYEGLHRVLQQRARRMIHRVKHPMALRQGLLRSPTCGTYPQGLTWATSWPLRSLQSLRKACGLCPCQRLAHRTFGTLVLLPVG